MAKWCNWQTQRIQIPRLVSSNLTLATIFIILLATLFGWTQDQDTVKRPTYKPEYIPHSTYDVPTKEEAQIKLETFLLSRYLWPVDMWAVTDVFDADVPGTNQPIRWFALVIKGDALKGYSLYIKFYLDNNELPNWDYGENETAEGRSLVYFGRKRAGILSRLEQLLIEVMDDKESHESILNGEAHLYRLVTKDSNVDKLRKEDRIY